MSEDQYVILTLHSLNTNKRGQKDALIHTMKKESEADHLIELNELDSDPVMAEAALRVLVIKGILNVGF